MSNQIVGKRSLTFARQLHALSSIPKSMRFLPYSSDAHTVKQATAKVNTGLTLTESCVEHLKKFAKSGEFLRISVEGGGCSGFSYKFELDVEKGEDDMTFNREGVEVVTDVDSFELIKGSKIDYETELIKSAFRVIENPQSTINCSCGVSFSIE